MATPGSPLVDVKERVAHRLEATGALDKLRAQIKATVFSALLAGSAGGGGSRCYAGGSGEGVAAAAAAGVKPPPAPAALCIVMDFLQRFDMEMSRETLEREVADYHEASPRCGDVAGAKEELRAGLLANSCDGMKESDSGALLEQVLLTAQRRAAASNKHGAIPAIPEETPEASH
eukprot:TRINITY_DN111535_c0_g1_i1.p1 TRINITY_DN111535_c0_g1~~TRINITY_DN111535_c0_g1_i1.p1  ORF type:complete len:175 (-),score=39.74 TRINITY_DN111535_c0_g1_i1:282-806(-)